MSPRSSAAPTSRATTLFVIDWTSCLVVTSWGRILQWFSPSAPLRPAPVRSGKIGLVNQRAVAHDDDAVRIGSLRFSSVSLMAQINAGSSCCAWGSEIDQPSPIAAGTAQPAEVPPGPLTAAGRCRGPMLMRGTWAVIFSRRWIIHDRCRAGIPARPAARWLWMTGLAVNPAASRCWLSEICVKPRNKKYFAFPEVRLGIYVIPSRPEGRSRSSRTRGGDRGGRGSALDERRGSVRQRRVVLTPRCWRQASAHPQVRKRR